MAFPRSDVVADATPAQQVPVGSAPSAPITVKIVVAGGFAVGKTTFIGSISDIEPLSTEAAMTEHSVGVDDAGGVSDRKTTTTVAMDFCRLALRPETPVFYSDARSRPATKQALITLVTLAMSRMQS